MVQIGTIKEEFKGEMKTMQKVRIGFEFPELTKVFKEENGPQPFVFSKEYTLSMADKANLRAVLTSWRGKAFTEEEAKSFDITKLLGVPCLINLTHKPSKSDATKIYEEISGITPLMKGMTCPPQVNPTFVLSYDEWDEAKFNTLPSFITDKMKTSVEYQALKNPQNNTFIDEKGQPIEDDFNDLPF
jgi:hypothetical protein